MIMTKQSIKIFTVLFLFFPSLTLAADESAKPCASLATEVPVGSSVGSADTWRNVTGRAGSLKVETKQLLGKASTGLTKATPPVGICPDYCELPSVPKIEFESMPTKFLTSYDDLKKCEDHLKSTKEHPLEYRNKSFSSMDELNDWYGDFSQGKGTEGKDLYNRCDGDCSPQYRSVITANGGKYLLNAFVVCGHARDKDDNTYQLKAKYVWICQNKKI